MKTRELISQLERAGFKCIRANKHWFYSNGTISVCVPRHKDVNKFLAVKILKQAFGQPANPIKPRTYVIPSITEMAEHYNKLASDTSKKMVESLVKKCECGALKVKTTHANWCDIKN